MHAIHFMPFGLQNSKTNLVQDVGVKADCIKMIKDSVQSLGGLDIIISNAGWTKFTSFGDLYAMTEDEWDKVTNPQVTAEQVRWLTGDSAGQSM